jgi:hypothetical protein
VVTICFSLALVLGVLCLLHLRGRTLLTMTPTGPGTLADMTGQTAALARRETAPHLTEASTMTRTGDARPWTIARSSRIPAMAFVSPQPEGNLHVAPRRYWTDL